jgi:hypothetical protein
VPPKIKYSVQVLVPEETNSEYTTHRKIDLLDLCQAIELAKINNSMVTITIQDGHDGEMYCSREFQLDPMACASVRSSTVY